MTKVSKTLALRRVSRGRVAKLGDHWLDGGRPVPCFLPEALDELSEAGLLGLADPDPDNAGQTPRHVDRRRSGPVRGTQRTEKIAMITPAAPRWVLSPLDGRSHVLKDNAANQSGEAIALCGHVMAASVKVSERPPSPEVCGTCEPPSVFEVPPPVFSTPTVF